MTKYCGMFVKGSDTTPNSVGFPVSAHCTNTHTHTQGRVENGSILAQRLGQVK